MALFRRLFKRSRPAVARLTGIAPEETQANQDAMRRHMEDEVAADRERRGATDARPGASSPAPSSSEAGAADSESGR